MNESKSLLYPIYPIYLLYPIYHYITHALTHISPLFSPYLSYYLLYIIHYSVATYDIHLLEGDYLIIAGDYRLVAVVRWVRYTPLKNFQNKDTPLNNLPTTYQD